MEKSSIEERGRGTRHFLFVCAANTIKDNSFFFYFNDLRMPIGLRLDLNGLGRFVCVLVRAYEEDMLVWMCPTCIMPCVCAVHTVHTSATATAAEQNVKRQYLGQPNNFLLILFLKNRTQPRA